MVLAAIRSHTRVQHERLEAQLNLLRPDLTRAHYAALLHRLHQLYLPLEDRIAGAMPLAGQLALALDARRKADLLRADLRALGQVAAPGAAELPRIADEAAAWGALYVLEGATLGGQIICRHLAPRLHLTPESGLSFYASYGALVGPRWKSFCALLTERHAGVGDDAPAFLDSAVRAAQETFSSFERWVVPALAAEAVPA